MNVRARARAHVCMLFVWRVLGREREREREREIMTNFHPFVDVRHTIMPSDCSVCNPFPSPVCPAVETGVCGSNPDSGPNSPPSSAHGSLANGSLSSLHSKEVRLSCDFSCRSVSVSPSLSCTLKRYVCHVTFLVCLSLSLSLSLSCTLERYVCQCAFSYLSPRLLPVL